MKIFVIGTGYVGLVTGSCLAEMGNNVTCIDNNVEKINNITEHGILPIYEPGLEELVKSNINANRLIFRTSIPNELTENSISFIAVGTPANEDGGANLEFVFQVAKEIGQKISHYCVVVDKSTVPVGTGDKVNKIIQNELDNRKLKIDFDVVSNPEFLKEGDALNDFNHPDRIIIGTNSDCATELISQLYLPLSLF